MGRTKLFKHFNDEGDTRPVNQKPHRLTVAQKKHLNNEIQQIIEESVSPLSSPIVMVLKKHGTNRRCIDLRKRNPYTIKNSFFLLRIDKGLKRRLIKKSYSNYFFH